MTNLNRTVAAFAVQEDNLKATIPQLRDVLKVGRPALQSLNGALPSLRAFAREALPGWHFHTNVGYSTPEHRAAIQERGISDLHRRSFQSIAYQQLGILEAGGQVG